jgi:protein-S-isoprenylcysteine O-methyltransferase Ste14
MSTFSWYEIPLLVIGLALLLAAVYLYFQQWSHINRKTRAYTYISEKERDKRALKAGFSAVIFAFGICFILSAILLRPITIQSIILFLTVGVCAAPLVMFAAMFRTRRDLEPYTKTEDDIVFLENANKIKDE